MRILMVDDDSNIINLYSVVLEPLCKDEGFHYAYSPSEAIEKINSYTYDLVISDFDMPPEGTGESVYNSWRDSSSREGNFMFYTSRELKELSFYEQDINKYHLQKPATLKQFKGFLQGITKEKVRDYFPIAIYHFARWKQTKFPIYIKINEGKYVKVFNENEEYDLDRLNKYIEKGEHFLHVKTTDEGLFFDEYDYSTVFHKEEFSYDNLKQNHHFLNAQVSMFGFTKQSLNTAKDTAEKILHIVESDSTLFDLLYRALSSKDFSYDHSYMIICISSFLCEQMMLDKQTLTKISTAALLHDVLLPTNKLTQIHDIEPERIEDLSPEERKQIENHDNLGNKLNELEQFGNEIQSIIEFHHSGVTNYPYEKHKKEITQLNIQQCIFQAAHMVACEIYKHDYSLSKVSDILTFSQYKYSGRNFDKIWHTMDYVFRHKLN
jgi:putative nucleotidyltransferase with HDIG domain